MGPSSRRRDWDFAARDGGDEGAREALLPSNGSNSSVLRSPSSAADNNAAGAAPLRRARGGWAVTIASSVAAADGLSLATVALVRRSCAAEMLEPSHNRFGGAFALLVLGLARVALAGVASALTPSARKKAARSAMVCLVLAMVLLAGALGTSVASAIVCILRVEKHATTTRPECDGMDLALAILALVFSVAHVCCAMPLAVAGAGSEADDDADGSDGRSDDDLFGEAEAGGAAEAAAAIERARESSGRARSTMRRLLALAKPEGGLLALGFVMLLLGQGGSLALPLCVARVIDAVATNADTRTHEEAIHGLNVAILVLTLVVVGSAVTTSIRAFCFNYAGQRVVARLRNSLFRSIVRQDIAFFDTEKTGDLISRLGSDTETLQDAATANVSMLFRYAIQIIGSMVLMAYSSWRLTLLVVTSVPILAVSMVVFGRYIRTYRKAFQDQLAKAATRAEESLSNVRTVKAFAAERTACREYTSAILSTLTLGKSMTIAGAGFQGITYAASFGTLVLVLAYGGRLVLADQITAGGLSGFLLYAIQIASSFGFLAGLFVSFAQALGASERVFALLAREPAMGDSRSGIAVPKGDFRGAVELQDVHFFYPARPEQMVLRGVSMRVAPGQKMSLVGASGSGKSTIIRLLLRFYDPVAGAIRLDDNDLRGLSQDWLRSNLGLVAQEPVLFSGSVRANIMYGKPTASEAEIEEAARAANAHSFVTALPDGYETLVGERGTQLSGGQKQRIAIARAIIRSPRVLLLDEATSALDAESEALVQDALDTLQEGRTTIVVAHRLATVIDSDAISVFSKGRLLEQGTHAELLANEGGPYSNLVRRQMIGGEEGSAASLTELDPARDDAGLPQSAAEVAAAASGGLAPDPAGESAADASIASTAGSSTPPDGSAMDSA